MAENPIVEYTTTSNRNSGRGFAVAVLLVMTLMFSGAAVFIRPFLIQLFMGLCAAVFFIELAGIAVSRLPEGKVRRSLNWAVAIPWLLINIAWNLFGLLSGVFLVLGYLVGIQAAFALIPILVWGPSIVSAPVFLYAILLSTLLCLSHGRTAIVMPLVRLIHIGESDRERYQYQIAKFDKFFRTLNSRRRAYELGIVVYMLGVVDKLNGSPLLTASWWSDIKDVSLEVLLTFLAIDTYITTFKPKVIDNNLPVEVRNTFTLRKLIPSKSGLQMRFSQSIRNFARKILMFAVDDRLPQSRDSESGQSGEKSIPVQHAATVPSSKAD
jgi:hypothetical protein